MYNNDDYILLLRGKLTDKRFRHSLAVADSAAELAVKYGADPEKAYTAGLLHDVMKDTPKSELLQKMEEFGIILTDLEAGAPKLWHAVVGAAYVERKVGITDRDIINSIRYHTTARAGMSALEKTIYLADYISADRDYDGVDEMRKAVKISFEHAMKIALVFSINSLAAEQKPIHPDTFECYNEIMMQK